jgi:hypothetical protein
MVPVRRVLLAALGSVLVLVGAGVLASPVLAAGDANEASCPNEASPGFRSYLPDCRAYELVSPAYKEGNFAEPLVGISSDGSRVIGGSPAGTFAGAQNSYLFEDFYEYLRTGSGWVTTALDPPAAEFPRSAFLPTAVSTSVAGSLWEAEAPPALGSRGEAHLYIRGSEAGGSGRLVEIGPVTPTQSEVSTVVGASGDLSHVLYELLSRSAKSLAQPLWPGDTTLAGEGGNGPHLSLYEYVGTGNKEPVLVGVRNSGPLKGDPVNADAELISQCGVELGGLVGAEGLSGTKFNGVSESGETVFFTANGHTVHNCPMSAEAPLVNEVYARVGGEKTVAISEPSLSVPGRVCTGVCEESETVEADRREGVFQGASEDGSKVFFTTEQQLVDGDADTSNDLYMEEVEGGAVKGLVQVSHDPNVGEAAEVQGVARISGDGSHVYFVARGVLATNGDGQSGEFATARAGADNLYVYEPDPEHAGSYRTVFVAELCSGADISGTQTDSECHESDSRIWGRADERRPVATTPDGRFLVFASSGDLTADDSSTVGQVFEFDAQTENLVRVSVGQCPPPKISCEAGERYNDDGNAAEAGEADAAKILEPNYAGALPDESLYHLSLSDDGQYVFFQSPSGLTPQASANQVLGERFGESIYAQNVYEYHAGNVYLVSDGHDTTANNGGESGVEFDGTDGSGMDVFFRTADSLVPQDTDTQVDLYDARIGGGFPAPVSSPACVGDACQGALSATPFVSSAGSTVQAGGGNLLPVVGPKPLAKAKPKVLSRAQKLAKALKACRGKPKRKRVVCESRARKQYGSTSKASKSARRSK